MKPVNIVSIAILLWGCLLAPVSGDTGTPDEGVCNYRIYSDAYPLIEGVNLVRIFHPCDMTSLRNVGGTIIAPPMTGSPEVLFWLAETISEAGMVAAYVGAAENMTTTGNATALKDGYRILRAENRRSDSPIYRKIGRYGIASHSLAGLCITHT